MPLDKEDRRMARYFLIAFCALSVLLIVLAAVFFTSGRRLDFMGDRLMVTSTAHDGITMQDRDGNQATLNFDFFDPQGAIIVRYLDITVTRRFSQDFSHTYYTFSDGLVWRNELVWVAGMPHHLSPPTLQQRAEMELINQMLEIMRSQVSVGMVMFFVILAMAFFLYGLWLICYPEKVWRFTHRNTVLGGEPTDYAIRTNKVAGVLIIIIAFVIVLIIASS